MAFDYEAPVRTPSSIAFRKIAKKTPSRLLEQAKPGPVTLIIPEQRAMSGKQPRPVPVMSVPPCLRDGTTEAGKRRARDHRMADYVVRLKDRDIGPSHDPYNQREVFCNNVKTGWNFTHVANGLGMDRLVINAPMGRTHAQWEYFRNATTDEERKAEREHFEFRDAECLRLVGITPQDAEAWFEETYEPDPMGSLSRYI